MTSTYTLQGQIHAAITSADELMKDCLEDKNLDQAQEFNRIAQELAKLSNDVSKARHLMLMGAR